MADDKKDNEGETKKCPNCGRVLLNRGKDEMYCFFCEEEV
tara:strand:- start:14731 stop:14850 length:120 start_codon:yes stop_codon:yes gene_type:complete